MSLSEELFDLVYHFLFKEMYKQSTSAVEEQTLDLMLEKKIIKSTEDKVV